MIPDHAIEAMILDGKIGYTPYAPALLNPASIDMTLHPQIRRPAKDRYGRYFRIDMAQVHPDHTEPREMMPYPSGYALEPGEFILACTNEKVHLPDDVLARVEGKSSIGRVGLAVHITAGFIDPGFKGSVTLEVANLSPWTIILYPDMRIAQIAFMAMDSPSRRPYQMTGHYQGQEGPTESRYHLGDRVKSKPKKAKCMIAACEHTQDEDDQEGVRFLFTLGELGSGEHPGWLCDKHAHMVKGSPGDYSIGMTPAGVLDIKPVPYTQGDSTVST